LEIQGVFHAYLGRGVDAVGLDYYLKRLGNGITLEQLRASVVASPEYYSNHGGGTDSGFLDAVFHDVLGRQVDDNGRAGFLLALSKGATREDVADVIFGSDEYRR